MEQAIRSDIAPRPLPRRRLLLLIPLLLGYLWLTSDSLVAMAAIWWRSDTYAHGMLVPWISTWLIYRQRARLAALPIAPDWLGLIPSASALLLWLAGRAADLAVIEQGASILLLIGLVWLLTGRALFVRLLFPLLYLFFAVPFGEELTPWLQQLTAAIAVQALQWSGIPVYLNGLFIEIPSGHFEVAEACSGIRYLIASFAVGTLYAYLSYRSAAKRLLFTLLALVAPLIANGVRAYLIIIIAHLSSMQYATGIDHLIYGWVFFGLVMLLLFWLGSYWADPPPAAPLATTPPAGRQLSAAASGAALALLLLGLSLDYRLSHSTAAAPAGPLQLDLAPWRATAAGSDWQPAFINPDRTLWQRFERAAAVDLYIADYFSERQDKELINQLNRFYDPHWSLAARTTRQLDTAAGPLTLVQLDIRHSQGGRRLVRYWYQVGSTPLYRDLEVKLHQAAARLRGLAPLNRVVVLSTEGDDPSAAAARLDRFIADLLPSLAASH